MKHKRGEIIAKHLDEIFIDSYQDKICKECDYQIQTDDFKKELLTV